MTAEEVRIEAFNMAKAVLHEKAYQLANAAGQPGNVNYPDIYEIINESLIIEQYLFMGVNSAVPTNQGAVATTTGGNIVLRSYATGGLGTTGSITAKNPNGPVYTGSTASTAKSATPIYTTIQMKMEDSVVGTLAAAGFDLVDELKDHLNDFHRVVHDSNSTSDISLYRSGVHSDVNGTTIDYIADVKKRP